MKPVYCKSILTKSKLPGFTYSFNPYVGCTHSCTYCYADYMRRFTGHDNDEWGKFVDYKENAAEVLAKELEKISGNPRILLGSATDCYQPAEKKLLLTRVCLERFALYDSNITILTKSDIIRRDIDILKGFSACETGISMGFSTPDACRLLEPQASTPEERINALAELHFNKIKTFVFIAPIIPYITRLDDIFESIAPYADYVMAEFLNLKDSNNLKIQACLTQLLGEEKTKKSLEMCKNPRVIAECKFKYENLCKKYGFESKGFFSHIDNN